MRIRVPDDVVRTTEYQVVCCGAGPMLETLDLNEARARVAYFHGVSARTVRGRKHTPKILARQVITSQWTEVQ